MIKIDAKGLACPKPVILTKKELDNLDSGEVETTVDNKVAVENLSRLAKGQGYEYSVVTISEDEYRVTINKSEKKDNLTCEIMEDEDYTLVIASDTMGGGEEELGHILMKSFMYTVTETKPLPNTMIFYNSGVFLTCEGSPVLDDIEKLAKEGVEIHSCGTCLDYYNLKDKFKIGEISNMYTIYEKIKEASKNVVIR
ncbi:sulfurtransferase-like selenium metabolism protein YedF [Miniphocaeibacter halophilus]|uniref:Sulfurtransferase-like selenium metabolism protein YedF n=1 Tax=Miniphocaeibacter halophilus TaxID=2931922 RepID=A0AC61NA73_9FIRM|nr:sulfurtransferase-like selenium metabolism protein YedF [Miniphocaeibacter halophilus]QQK08438.1 sulfurtransferase-like selenium metabolism protein YedF [Miniphocaeibacter halophilus]